MLTGAKNVVCQLTEPSSRCCRRARWTRAGRSAPLPGGASKRQLFTATCLRLEFPGIFSNEEEAACPHDTCASANNVASMACASPMSGETAPRPCAKAARGSRVGGSVASIAIRDASRERGGRSTAILTRKRLSTPSRPQ